MTYACWLALGMTPAQVSLDATRLLDITRLRSTRDGKKARETVLDNGNAEVIIRASLLSPVLQCSGDNRPEGSVYRIAGQRAGRLSFNWEQHRPSSSNDEKPGHARKALKRRPISAGGQTPVPGHADIPTRCVEAASNAAAVAEARMQECEHKACLFEETVAAAAKEPTSVELKELNLERYPILVPRVAIACLKSSHKRVRSAGCRLAGGLSDREVRKMSVRGLAQQLIYDPSRPDAAVIRNAADECCVPPLGLLAHILVFNACFRIRTQL